MADELSNYHIECKGTRDWCLSKNTLQAWKAQLATDCPPEKLAVLFWKANNTDWIGIYPTIEGIVLLLDAKNCVKMMLAYEKELNAKHPLEEKSDLHPVV